MRICNKIYCFIIFNDIIFKLCIHHWGSRSKIKWDIIRNISTEWDRHCLSSVFYFYISYIFIFITVNTSVGP